VNATQRKRLIRWSQKAQDRALAAVTLTSMRRLTNPVDSLILQARAMKTGNGVTCWELSTLPRVEEVPTGCLPVGRMPEEAKARGNALDMLTSGRCPER
jgi:hypothetical protein